jgi:nitrite reductase/ring-hydroxylating ferredoxin subunit
LITEVKPIVEGGAGRMRVRLSDFPALDEPFGSVRIGTSSIGANHYPLGLWPPVLINRGPNALQFFVMSAACTHEGCIVPTFPQASGATGVIECLCHQSRYLIDGTVIRGPAGRSLDKYDFQVHDGVLDIQIPDQQFASIDIRLAQTGVNRVELSFIGFANIEYEIYSWTDVGAPGTLAAFALTPNGAMTETSISGSDDVISVYLPGAAAGFYEVAMKTRAV